MKTPFERKLESERFLIANGIPINENLPMIEKEEETELRGQAEIARRILILSYLNMIAEGENREEIIRFLKGSNLWEGCSPIETELFDAEEFSEQEKINISWQSEAIWIMLWAIKKIEKLNLPTHQCEVRKIVECLPNYLEPIDQFICEAELRDKSEILDKSDLIYRLHWAARQAWINKERMPANISHEVIMEWHYAINWITNYENLEWDDITTDT